MSTSVICYNIGGLRCLTVQVKIIALETKCTLLDVRLTRFGKQPSFTCHRMATPLYSASFLNPYINSCIRFNPTLGFFLKGHGLQVMWHLTDVLFHFHCCFKTIETRNMEITAHSLDLKQCLDRRVK